MASMPPISKSGGVMAQATGYGFKNDPNGDSLTRGGWGFRDNQLTPHAAALSDITAAQTHANPGDVIELVDANGNKKFSYYADRSPQNKPNVDLYEPQGFDPSVADNQQVINLGGGDPKAHGAQLAALGEANVSRMGGMPQPSSVTQANPISDPNILSQNPSAFNIAPQPSPWHSPNYAPTNPQNQTVQNPVDNYALGRLFASHPMLAQLLG